jgi:hypothetical protein
MADLHRSHACMHATVQNADVGPNSLEENDFSSGVFRKTKVI